jgi:hypothetical protein
MDRPVERGGAKTPRQRGSVDNFPSRLAEAVSEFGATIRQPLAARLGGEEDQIGSPVARLVRSAGLALGLNVVTHAETPLSELSMRPDFAVSVANGATGFIEVKRPGKRADPAAWPSRSHDGRQWQKMRLLPNVLYTDGSQWALYRDGERVGPVARLDGALDSAGRFLKPADDRLAQVLEEFLWHPPTPPRDLRSLVRAAARLCRYLREEVTEILEHERTAGNGRPFTTLAQEWRALLFPRMTEDAKFADAYAQTITFALLLARNAGIAFEGRDLPAIGRQLGKHYALIGRALRVLADPAAADQLLIIETLRRIIGAVDWDHLEATSTGTHATLYEAFLQEYDPALRRRRRGATPRSIRRTQASCAATARLAAEGSRCPYTWCVTLMSRCPRKWASSVIGMPGNTKSPCRFLGPWSLARCRPGCAAPACPPSPLRRKYRQSAGASAGAASCSGEPWSSSRAR